MAGFPYEEQFEVHRTLPEEGTGTDEVLSMLSAMSRAENPVWEGGQCSGTMYCGDHDHYNFSERGLLLTSPTSTPSNATCARARPSSRPRSSP